MNLAAAPPAERARPALRDAFPAFLVQSDHCKGLFADFDTTSTRLGNTVVEKNKRLAAVLKGVADPARSADAADQGDVRRAEAGFDEGDDVLADRIEEPGQDRLAMLQEVVLETVVHPLHGQRLAGQVGRAGVLAAAAFGAGEGVETFLPVQVEHRALAGLVDVLLDLGRGQSHDLLDPREGVGAQRPAEGAGEPAGASQMRRRQTRKNTFR